MYLISFCFLLDFFTALTYNPYISNFIVVSRRSMISLGVVPINGGTLS
nr:MAG TPA: hypothetical protein [Bacteriophage sp.]